ncbi:MAG: 50S ribosomal protein L11 methyltransferase [Deltaproteobacteria bacterium]|nr:50S ribosomal protein L11 methyltransferase [Deltaproteobacteria bacterium]
MGDGSVAESGILFSINVDVDETTLPALQGLLFRQCPWGWEESESEAGRVRLTAHFHRLEDRDLTAGMCRERWPEAIVSLAEIKELDWALAWREFFTPVEVGDAMVVLPSWEQGSQVEGSRHILYIEPQMAFGTGHHQTTVLCLEAVIRLHRAGRLGPGTSFLDLGTGSGILGIGCALLGMQGIGLDIDPAALANAETNIELNGVADRFSVRKGSAHTLEGDKPFDLILANILAEPLKRMAKDIVSALASGGALVLSGLLVDQAGAVAERYEGRGLGRPTRYERGEWAALVWA